MLSKPTEDCILLELSWKLWGIVLESVWKFTEISLDMSWNLLSILWWNLFALNLVWNLWNCPGLSVEIVFGFYCNLLGILEIVLNCHRMRATRWQRKWAQRKTSKFALELCSSFWLRDPESIPNKVLNVAMKQGASKYVQPFQTYFNLHERISEHPTQGVSKKPQTKAGGQQASVWKALSNARSTCKAQQSRQVHSLKESVKFLIHLFSASKCWHMFMSYTKKWILSYIKSSFILKPPYRPFLAKRNFTNSMLKFSGDTLTHFLATGKYSIIFNLCSTLLVYSNMRVVKLCAVNSTVAHIQVQWSCPCP